MPKIVDHEERRQYIAEAAWRVILEHGMRGATVRNIAKEAGISLGALRHYFSTQEELLVFVMRLVHEKVMVRLSRILQADLPPKEKALQVLLELLPVDEQRRAEMEVWFSFTFHARYMAMGDGEKLNDGIQEGIVDLLRFLRQTNVLRPELDLELEAEKLYAIVNGLALHGLLEPDRLKPERVEQVMTQHLDSICVPT